MIVPLIDEANWMQLLDAVPVWTPSVESMLVIAPHPDDETLGAGGLIAAQRARGVDVVVAAVTDGENAYPNYPGLAAIRRQEQTAALGRLGVSSEKILRFGLPDSDVSSYERQLVDHLMPIVTRDMHIVAPWRGDFHPDHEACGRTAEEIARRTGARLTSYFFWTWHRGTPDLLQSMCLETFPLSTELLQTKTEALQCHHSQLFHESGEPILPDYLSVLRGALLRFF